MSKNYKNNSKNSGDYNSELLLKILNKTSVETKNSESKELFVNENCKIKSNNLNSSDNSNLIKILSEIFPDRKILVKDNNDGSQTIFLY